jgi:hypothetical protein
MLNSDKKAMAGRTDPLDQDETKLVSRHHDDTKDAMDTDNLVIDLEH